MDPNSSSQEKIKIVAVGGKLFKKLNYNYLYLTIYL